LGMNGDVGVGPVQYQPGTVYEEHVMPVTAPPAIEPALIDAKCVAQLLGCSSRHVVRLADAGELPPPVRVGRLVRWPRRVILDWIERGCPVARRTKP
jgi:excisionase family DNA binding protein